jgi:D-beta-D-heptose 7-phosphate kinase/D-beta-D-heptose 1-phosphate adenosyltransferase
MGPDIKRMRAIVSGLSNARVMVVGDIMLDEYVWGDTSRISPEAPVPIVKVTKRSHGLGGAGNVVQNLRALGSKVLVVAAVGDDTRGEQVRDYLRDAGADTDGLLAVKDRPTTVKTRIIARGQQVVRVDDEISGDIPRKDLPRLREAVMDRLDDFDALIVSDYGKGIVTEDLLSDIIPACRKAGKVVAVDPKYPKFLEYKGTSLITPNTKEAGEFLNRPLDDEKDIITGGKEILKALECDEVLITRGADGMSLFQKGGKVVHIPAIAIEVFDVTGAGDTVISVFTACLATSASPVEAAYISNLAASVVVRKIGAATANPAEVMRMATGPGGRA